MNAEMLIMLASAMSTEQIVQKLEESISELKEAQLLGNEKEITKQKHLLGLSCHLYTMHIVTEGSMEKAMSTIGDMTKTRERLKIFETGEN